MSSYTPLWLGKLENIVKTRKYNYKDRNEILTTVPFAVVSQVARRPAMVYGDRLIAQVPADQKQYPCCTAAYMPVLAFNSSNV